jgi:hypothetical protein
MVWFVVIIFSCFLGRTAVGQDMQKALPGVQAAPWEGAGARQTFKREDLHLDVRHKSITHDTRDFDFTAYHDYASAAATGCQVFKEKDQKLWWANCGQPINDFVVLSSVTQGG